MSGVALLYFLLLTQFLHQHVFPYDKKSDYQIKINGNGVYSFQTRLHVNSPTGNKRVEVALFKNGDRYAAYASGYTTPVNYTMTYLNNYILYLSEGDTIDFRIAPIDGYSVNVQMGDILIYALDYDLWWYWIIIINKIR